MTRLQAQAQLKAIKSILHSTMNYDKKKVQFQEDTNSQSKKPTVDPEVIIPIEPSQGKPESSIGEQEF